ncbi:MAG: hypothetical protein V5A88_08705, partial [Candidatus Thermoplasmatota archaeon]
MADNISKDKMLMTFIATAILLFSVLTAGVSAFMSEPGANENDKMISQTDTNLDNDVDVQGQTEGTPGETKERETRPDLTATYDIYDWYDLDDVRNDLNGTYYLQNDLDQ